MTRLTGKIIRKFPKILRRLRAYLQVTRLFCRQNEASRTLAKAVIETIHNKLTTEETIWVEKIETLRKELNLSTDEIIMPDYGAGAVDQEEGAENKSSQCDIKTRIVGQMCLTSSKPYLWTIFLLKLTRKFRPSVCLELGTCMGISASYQAAALKMNSRGKMVTLEGAQSLAEIAQKNFQALGLDNIDLIIGRFQDTLNDVLREHEPIDYAFIDGHHEEKATIAYFEQILPFLSERALLIFDDISWSEGMKRAWSTIETNENIALSIDLANMGICILEKGCTKKQSFSFRIS